MVPIRAGAGNQRGPAKLVWWDEAANQAVPTAAREAFMGSTADSIVIKILIGVATAAVWFVLSRAASADQQFVGAFAAQHTVAQASAQAITIGC